ncbi:DGQHR domain-containing protein [Rhizobium brockwellii]|uniref:DGQHR domain-containing protein n=1 Tax=Rhizobium brockwellii TaxID=3019932 RepID=UPI003F9E8727
MKTRKHREVPALTVNQWLPGWEKIDFDPEEHRAKPPKQFYLFSLPARELRSLSGIVRRQAKNAAPRTDDLGIQRQHDPERSEEISRFVEYGYPWSTLSVVKRASAEFNDLRKPGWLPTAVVLNILVDGSERNGIVIDSSDVVSVVTENGTPKLELPYEKWDSKWTPAKLPPFEVIDGQHRLWAFEGASQFENFELPVVAFVGLDISWQAYLFWTINIKPKRINSSLAFDLYPLLRNEDWLDRAEGHQVYKETRAQELTEIMWSYPESAWYDKINMLGEKQIPWVTQSAWIKSLTATFIRSWDGRTGATGGLFGGRSKREGEVLGWSRAQQSAFLIFVWNALKSSVEKSNEPWALDLRHPKKAADDKVAKPPENAVPGDAAFYGPNSLIASDQGVRGYLQIVNDVFYSAAAQLRLNRWYPDERSSPNPIGAVQSSLGAIQEQPFAAFAVELAERVSSFDWRTSSTPNLDEATRRAKLVFRGSSGYKELRLQLLEHLASGDDSEVKNAATRLMGRS